MRKISPEQISQLITLKNGIPNLAAYVKTKQCKEDFTKIFGLEAKEMSERMRLNLLYSLTRMHPKRMERTEFLYQEYLQAKKSNVKIKDYIASEDYLSKAEKYYPNIRETTISARQNNMFRAARIMTSKPPQPQPKPDVFNESTYLVVLGKQVAGFETEEQVMTFIKESGIIGGIKVFKSVNVQLNLEIKFN